MIPGVTNKFSPLGLLNTMNPLSPFVRTFQRSVTDPAGAMGNDYVPDWLTNLFGGGTRGQQAAHITSKVALGGLTAAAVVWAARSLAHELELDKLNKANLTPADKLESIYEDEPHKLIFDTAKRKPAKKSSKKKEEKPVQQNMKKTEMLKQANGKEPNPMYHVLAGSIPLLTTAIVAMASGYYADSVYDAIQHKKVNDSTQQAQNKLNQLVIARAKLNRLGQMPNKELLQKHASGDNKKPYSWASGAAADLQQALMVLASVLVVGAGAAGFAYQRNSDQMNVKFKAYKKGLQEYVKAKQKDAPARTFNADSRIAAELDSALNKEQPAAQPQNFNPVKSIDI